MFYIFVLWLFLISQICDSAPVDDNKVSRIVGGLNATIEEVPWQVSLHYYPINHCGGSIINDDTILTAAHCFVNRSNPNAFQVRVGTDRRSIGGKLYKVKNIIIHPKFDEIAFFYDIAIVKLSTKLKFNSKVKPIKLPEQDEPLPVGEYGMTTGWGRLKNKGEFPKQLQKVFLPILSQEFCKALYQDIAEIIDEMFCAGTLDGFKDACNGDSGGPFVVNGKLFGIISTGMECASENYPGIFTAVNKLRYWIEKNI